MLGFINFLLVMGAIYYVGYRIALKWHRDARQSGDTGGMCYEPWEAFMCWLFSPIVLICCVINGTFWRAVNFMFPEEKDASH